MLLLLKTKELPAKNYKTTAIEILNNRKFIELKPNERQNISLIAYCISEYGPRALSKRFNNEKHTTETIKEILNLKERVVWGKVCQFKNGNLSKEMKETIKTLENKKEQNIKEARKVLNIDE